MDLSKIILKVKDKKAKRRGRGAGSGRGKTSGRGHKGAGQRKGKKLPYAGFRGGNLPYARRMPKRGFTPPRRRDYQTVTLRDIESKLKNAAEINPTVLKKARLLKNEKKPIKIIAGPKDKFPFKLVVKANKFSSHAKELIESAGGSAQCLKP